MPLLPDLSVLSIEAKQPRSNTEKTTRKAKASPYARVLTPSATQDNGDVDYQSYLKLEGLVVVPTPLTDQKLRTQAQQDFLTHLKESPEFNNPDTSDSSWKPVLGGFAALGNPSSFHHPWVRKMREQLTSAILETDALPIDGRKLENPFDRLIYRIVGETPSAESMHRDEAATALDGDTVFGGWVNLDDEPQYFSCCPRTHKDVGGKNKGFAKIEKSEYEKFRSPSPDRPAGWVVVEIPPGSALIFYERLVHEVNPTPAVRRMLRMALGWRVTDSEEPLFGAQTDEWVRSQAVPKIKSGQNPVVFPSAYYNFTRNFQTLTDWSKRTFVQECLYEHSVNGGPLSGSKWTRVKQKMDSLSGLGLRMHRSYDSDEVALLKPQREWNLYTFDSPDKRVEHKAVSQSDWEAYKVALASVSDPKLVRRPRPEQM